MASGSYGSSLPSSLAGGGHYNYGGGVVGNPISGDPASQSFSRNSGTNSGASNDAPSSSTTTAISRQRSSVLRRQQGRPPGTISSVHGGGGGGGGGGQGSRGSSGTSSCCGCCGGNGGKSSASPLARFWRSICCCFSRQRNEQRKVFFIRLLYSRWWRIMTILFTVILLFGGPMRWLLIPSAADGGIDVLFCLTFGFFCLDILMRMDAEPMYFPFSLPCGGGGGELSAVDGGGHDNNNNSKGCCGFQVGSFLFWCDLVSTLSLLHEISFVDKRNFAMIEVGLMLDEYGFLKTGLEDINESVPFELETLLLVTIARTARVARFSRSSTLAKISSKVNWYWFLDVLNPFYWLGKLFDKLSELWNDCRSRSSKSSNKKNAKDRKSNSRKGKVDSKQQGEGSASSNSKRGLRGGGGGDDHNSSNKSNNDNDNNKNAAAPAPAAAAAAPSSNRTERALEKRSFLMMRSSTTAKTKSSDGGGGIPASARSSNASISEISASPAKRLRQQESQVGSAMRELTGQRVAMGIIIALVLVVIFTYGEVDVTRATTMVVLHNQTAVPKFANKALTAARMSSAPDLFVYELANDTKLNYSLTNGEDWRNLRPRETLLVRVRDEANFTTAGYFSFSHERRLEAAVSLLTTLFIVLTWLFGVTAFAGPVMILVVIPIERMVRLLGMLMLDPLGYQSTPRYEQFCIEEDEITKNTRWTKDVLKGMETSFLMSTILRIGSLMKVGFGSAGVEIIRRNLEKGHTKNHLILSSQGSTVSCIFLFCDIRQFTDATECLQEEVFVFTNRVAAVVHSFCNAYGGSANKNIGDAFLVSWLLEEKEKQGRGGGFGFGGSGDGDNFTANDNQADKALLAVINITKALHFDDFYVEKLGHAARDALLAKLAKRKGPVVQMGCGLHAGTAVQGAIGSQRKIDATYVSEAVERAEFLESSTKMYGVKMLMSDSFHRLLHPNNQRRCRKVDQLIIKDDDENDDDDDPLNGEIMELLTFDMDIDALWRKGGTKKRQDSGAGYDSDSAESGSRMPMPAGLARAKTSDSIPSNPFPPPPSGGRATSGMPSVPPPPGAAARATSGSLLRHQRMKGARRRSVGMLISGREGSDELTQEGFATNFQGGAGGGAEQDDWRPPELVLPTGIEKYSAQAWVDEDMRKIRHLYSDGLFFQTFNGGLNSFYAKDWVHAKQCFLSILERFEDGPSRYFLNQIQKHNGVPPRDFCGYGRA